MYWNLSIILQCPDLVAEIQLIYSTCIYNCTCECTPVAGDYLKADVYGWAADCLPSTTACYYVCI